MSTSAVHIDLVALEQELEKLSPEEIQKQLVDIRTRQAVQQGKNKDAQKAYMKKRAEMVKLMTAKAKELGIYDNIQSTAKANAAAKLKEIAEQEADGELVNAGESEE